MTEAAINAARKRRALLYESMCKLEGALSVPAGSAAWLSDLSATLKAVQYALDDHIAEVESPFGIIPSIMNDAPRLIAHTQILLDDHPRLHAQAEEVAAQLDGAAPTPGPDDIGVIREAALDLLGELIRHRSLGADLVYEAYNVDIGGQS